MANPAPEQPPSISRWRIFAAAPHRMLFVAGATQLMLVMILWSAELLARAGVWTLPSWTIAPIGAHAFLMLYGLFPLFIFGFLLTVYPRWMALPEVPAAHYVPVFVLLACGLGLFYLGLFTARGLVVTGVLVYGAGWATALSALLGVYRRAQTRGPHERLLNAALAAGALGVFVQAYGLYADNAAALAAARALGLWLFLVPVLLTILHRMLPFFSSVALPQYPWTRPAWTLPLLGVCILGHAALEILDAHTWLFVFDAPLAFLALHHSYTWHARRSLEVPLLAMLHIALLWFAAAMTLYSAQSLALLLAQPLALGRAALHALGIGFVAGTLVSMATRVTLGHSGRPVEADALTWYCFLGMNLAALLRVAAEFFPGPAGAALNVLAAAAWIISFLPWIWRYAPMYLQPRIDRRPG